MPTDRLCNPLSSRLLGAIALATGLLFSPTTPGAAGDRVMERADTRTSGDSGIAEIEFSETITIATQCQPTPSVFCEIELQLTTQTPATGALPDIHESITPSRRDAFPLTRIDYSQATERRGRLALQFEIPVIVTASTAPNGRSVIINYEAPSLNLAPASNITPTVTADIKIITLKSSEKPLNANAEKTVLPALRYDMYTSTHTVNGKSTYLLHMGFFDNQEVAERTLDAAITDYPTARIETIPGTDIDRALTWFGSRKRNAQTEPGEAESKNSRLMESARQALIAGDNPTAIRAYSSVVQSNDPEYLAAALEYLGVARERNRQLAHAKAEYEEFLRRYPEGEAHARVKQRLEGLITARTAPKEALKDAGKVKPVSRWEFYGSLSQFIRGFDSRTNTSTDTTSDSALDTNFNITARQRENTHHLRTEFSGSHHQSLSGEDDDSSARIYNLNAEVAHKDGSYSIKAGRQSVNSGGIYGRFDGIHYTHSINKTSRLAMSAGYLVDYGDSGGINLDRYFGAARLNTATADKSWNGSVYVVEQINHGLTDRRAIGADAQYFRDGNSLFAIVDYDIYFGQLNQATLMASRQFANKSSLGLTADYRKSPLLSVNNAIIGQVVSLSELKSLYTENELKQLALDRTADYQSLSVSYSKPITEKYQFSADLSASTLGGTPASGGIDAIPDQGTEYYFSTQIVGNDIFGMRDISIAGLRYSDSDTSNTSTVTLSTRLSINTAWRVNPRLAFDWRENFNGSSQQTIRTSFLVDYRARRSLLFQMEASYDFSRTEGAVTTDELTSRYIFAGYIFDF